MEMQVYIANLGKYTEGELEGAWFTPPIDLEEVKERIGLHGSYEEYAIHDYELPFEIDEYTPIEEINRLCEIAEELVEWFPEEDLRAIQTNWFSSLEEMAEHKDDIIFYRGCNDMEDVARELIEEGGYLAEVPDLLKIYIDYEAYGRDLFLNGRFLETPHGVYEYSR